MTGTPGNLILTPGSVVVETDNQGRKALAKTPSAPLAAPTIPSTALIPTTTSPNNPFIPPVVTSSHTTGNGAHFTGVEQLPAVITTTGPDGKQTIQVLGESASFTVTAPKRSAPPAIKSLWARLINLINSIFAKIMQIKMDYLSR